MGEATAIRKMASGDASIASAVPAWQNSLRSVGPTSPSGMPPRSAPFSNYALLDPRPPESSTRRHLPIAPPSPAPLLPPPPSMLRTSPTAARPPPVPPLAATLASLCSDPRGSKPALLEARTTRPSSALSNRTSSSASSGLSVFHRPSATPAYSSKAEELAKAYGASVGRRPGTFSPTFSSGHVFSALGGVGRYDGLKRYGDPTMADRQLLSQSGSTTTTLGGSASAADFAAGSAGYFGRPPSTSASSAGRQRAVSELRDPKFLLDSGSRLYLIDRPPPTPAPRAMFGALAPCHGTHRSSASPFADVSHVEAAASRGARAAAGRWAGGGRTCLLGF